MSHGQAPIAISEWELQVLVALRQLVRDHKPFLGEWQSMADEGWSTSANVRHKLNSNSLETRRTLRRLADWGYLDSDREGQVQYFRLNNKADAVLLSPGEEGAVSSVDSSSWTGIVSPIQISQVMQIVSEIEDICETILENEARSQILGLVRALGVLLEIPNPPRRGIIELVRDPAFANIVQVTTCLAAIVAAVRA